MKQFRFIRQPREVEDWGHLMPNFGFTIRANFGDLEVKVEDIFIIETAVVWVETKAFTTFNQFVDITPILPDNAPDTFTAKRSDDFWDRISMVPFAGQSRRALVRVTGSRDFAAETAALKKLFLKDNNIFATNPDAVVDEIEGYTEWLTDYVDFDEFQRLTVETLLRLLSEQYGVDVSDREVMAKIGYEYCKKKGPNEQIRPYLEGTQYEDPYLRLVLGTDIFDSIKDCTAKILGD